MFPRLCSDYGIMFAYPFCLFPQIPRLYNVYKEMGIVTSFQNMLDNIFLPLFEVTVDPDSHPHLHLFLKQVNMFSQLSPPNHALCEITAATSLNMSSNVISEF